MPCRSRSKNKFKSACKYTLSSKYCYTYLFLTDKQITLPPEVNCWLRKKIAAELYHYRMGKGSSQRRVQGWTRGLSPPQTHNLAPPPNHQPKPPQSRSRGNAFQKPYNHPAEIKSANTTLLWSKLLWASKIKFVAASSDCTSCKCGGWVLFS